MSQRLPRRRVLASLGAGSALVAGCLGDDNGDDGDNGDDNGDTLDDGDDGDPGEDRIGGTLHITQEDERAEEFDPVISRGSMSEQVWSHVFDRLYDYDEGMGFVPKVAAEMPETERDDTRFIIPLREGIEFHNGDPLTAEDVAHSFIAPVEEQTDNLPFFDMVESTEAIDEHTAQIDLDFPSGVFVNYTLQAHGIVPMEARTEDREEFNENPIGSGPYIFDDFEYNEYVELVRNDDYWGEPEPLLDRVRYEAVQDDATRTANIRADDTDIMMNVPDSDIPILEDEPGINVQSTESVGFFFVSFNCREEAVTGDVDVRRGISHAFSIPDWVDTQLPNNGVSHEDFFGDPINSEWDFPADRWEEMYPEYDPELAEELLAEHAPEDWTPKIASYAFTADLAEEIALRLGEIGYEAEVQILDILPMIQAVTESDPDDLDIWLFGISEPDPSQYTYGLIHESRFETTISPYYEGSEDFHDKMDQARRSVDREERRELYIDIVDEILENYVYLPAFDTATTAAHPDRVRGFEIHPNISLNPRLNSEHSHVWLDE